MQQIKSIKLANSIKCGPNEEVFFAEGRFEITLEQGLVIRIKEKKSGDETCTTLMNTIYWKPKKEDAPIVLTHGKAKGKEKGKDGGGDAA